MLANQVGRCAPASALVQLWRVHEGGRVVILRKGEARRRYGGSPVLPGDAILGQCVETTPIMDWIAGRSSRGSRDGHSVRRLPASPVGEGHPKQDLNQPALSTNPEYHPHRVPYGCPLHRGTIPVGDESECGHIFLLTLASGSGK